MRNCCECKEKLGLLKGYYHPALGKNNLICSKCYDEIAISMQKWMDFVMSNSFKNELKPKSFDKKLILNISKIFKLKDIIFHSSYQ